MIVVDSNVLLNAYRFAPKAREELLALLDKVSSNLWLPHQVGLEYHRRRHEVLLSNRTPYGDVIRSINAQAESSHSALGDKINYLANRAALSDAQREAALTALSQSLVPLGEIIASYQNDHQPLEPNADPVLERLQAIFDQRVGEPFDDASEKAAKAESERRNRDKIPPGYKDAPGHGDYFVWRQTLDEASKRKPHFLVFVTSDNKEDWYQKVGGQNVGPRPELVDEAFRGAGAQLIMMSTRSFLSRGAEYFDDLIVSQATLNQAEDLAEGPSPLESDLGRSDMTYLLKSLVGAVRLVQMASYEGRVRLALEEVLSEVGATVQAASEPFNFRISTSDRSAFVILREAGSGNFSASDAYAAMGEVLAAAATENAICITNGRLDTQVVDLIRRGGFGTGIEFISWRSGSDNQNLRRAATRALS
ncbi:PIN-like domain-containing protein [Actinoplanes sp. NPDC020271]|uniref:PIN-like domain-containing protein n=1 Tax=Actinoplanes sp. NPDC020271 TaxID=3363896 RepID=UPI0037A977D3